MLILLLGAIVPGVAQLPRRDAGIFIIRQHGQILGQERFQLRANPNGGALLVRLDYTISGRAVRQTADLQWQAGFHLRSYAWHQSTDAITVTYAAGHIRAHYQPARRQSQLFQFQMPPATAILDANIYSLWEPLADRYDLSKGGAQTFSVFVPHTGNPGQVSLIRITPAAAKAAKDIVQLRAETGQAAVYLTLRQGRLLRLTLPDAGLTVSRRP